MTVTFQHRCLEKGEHRQARRCRVSAPTSCLPRKPRAARRPYGLVCKGTSRELSVGSTGEGARTSPCRLLHTLLATQIRRLEQAERWKPLIRGTVWRALSAVLAGVEGEMGPALLRKPRRWCDVAALRSRQPRWPSGGPAPSP